MRDGTCIQITHAANMVGSFAHLANIVTTLFLASSHTNFYIIITNMVYSGTNYILVHGGMHGLKSCNLRYIKYPTCICIVYGY